MAPPPLPTSERKLKQPFKAVADLSRRTGELTKSAKLDPTIRSAINGVSKSVTTVKTRVHKTSKVSLYLLGFLGLLASGGIFFTLLIPAVIFFPVTIFLGVATSIGFIASAPVAFVLGWILLSSEPIQEKVVVPTLNYVLENPKLKRILLASN